MVNRRLTEEQIKKIEKFEWDLMTKELMIYTLRNTIWPRSLEKRFQKVLDNAIDAYEKLKKEHADFIKSIESNQKHIKVVRQTKNDIKNAPKISYLHLKDEYDIEL
jgi:hypothetical protein